MEEAWKSVTRGERQAIFLGGEPGSGKSRIAAELARGLHVQDVVVLVGNSSPYIDSPYEPLVGALNHLLVGARSGELAGLIPDSASELLRLTPHIHLHRPDLSEPGPGRGQRRALFTAYIDLIKAVAADRPVAIVLEDMHWSSAPTRRLMAHLIENTQSDRVLVLATMRNTTPDRSDDLSHTVADLYRLPGVSRIDLAGLQLEDVEQYLHAALDNSQSHIPEIAVLLRDQTGGNPFYLREVSRELATRGDLTPLRTRQLEIPHSVRDTVTRRTRSLDATSRTVLEYAAVLGAGFEASDLVEAFEASPEETLVALDLAVAAGLVASTGPGAYVFQHSLIRQALLDNLSPSESAGAHARLAVSMENLHGDDPVRAPLLARLYEGAGALGYRDKTAHYLSLAAQTAHRGLAHEEAADLWEKAARSVASDREELLLAAAQSHSLAGDFPEARRIYREVIASTDPETAVRAAIGFEDASWRPGILGDDARSLLESAIDRIDPRPDDPLFVRALVALGRSHTFSGDLQTSSTLGEQALTMARGVGDDSLVAEALAACAVQLIGLPSADEGGSELAAELRDIAIRTGNHDKLGTAGTLKAFTAYLRSDPHAWQEGWNDVKLAADNTGESLWQWVAGCYEHCHAFMAGHFREAEEIAVRLNEIGYAFGPDEAEGPYGIQMYMIRRETGGLESIRSLLTGDPSQDGTWTPGLLSLYTELDMEDSARALLERSLELPRTISQRMSVYPAVIAFMAEAALYLEDVDAIRKLLPSMETFEGFNLLVGQCVTVLGSANTYLGQMHTALGQFEMAESHFRTALAMDISMGSIVHQSLTLAHYATLLDQMGETDRADELRSQARRLAEPIGHERALRLLDSQVSPLPDGLTPREIEVLRLLVAGASNKEIGARLFISPNTAANHVRNILVKTRSANRTAAAIYARERQLH